MYQRLILIGTLLTVTQLAIASDPGYQFTDVTPSGFSRGVIFAAAGNQQVGQGKTGTSDHAFLLNGGAGTDLHPSGYVNSIAAAVTNQYQFGSGEPVANPGKQHALLWQGSAASVIDLNPQGYDYSEGLNASASGQIGHADLNGIPHAVYWQGSAQGAVDLHSSAYSLTFGTGLTSLIQVGFGFPTSGSGPRALVWHGTAASVEDLTPDGYAHSMATDVVENQIVGLANPNPNNPQHAMLWFADSDNYVDLNPTGYQSSGAEATNGLIQVGEAVPTSSTNSHAMLWSGSAASALDLHAFVPAPYTESNALAVGDIGVIYGWVSNGGASTFRAAMWAPIPEPSSGFIALGLWTLIAIRRRRQWCFRLP